MGTAGRIAPQHYAHRARACRELARQAGLERAHRLRYRTLLSAAPAGSLLAWGRFAQQMVEGKLAATGAGKASGKFCLASTHPSPLSANRATAELPAFMGSRPFSAANRLLEQHGSTPSTGLASAKNRYIKNAPDGFPSGAFPIRAK